MGRQSQEMKNGVMFILKTDCLSASKSSAVAGDIQIGIA
jgi:hypothetical protein